ncbi:bifunctional Gfo/Idh/MocA family oxidoreductase/class I SAM-dependent methyltransferase [Staphylococcus coagulans]|uniref:bifunctional Gfo/Idh/MocA family oxidoreductase/class I SAM-dependent methyltransferase n=1 Tax=Staphylococcus coagulans TaxID=74706 RepID=UPI0030EEC8B7
MKKCIVCGSRFGQFYIEALKSIPNIKLYGLLASGSERSIDCANHYQIQLYNNVDDLPNDIDFACIAIKSEVQGGKGNLIAEALLKRGIDVIFEQPLSEKEYISLFKLARKEKRYFTVCNLYSQLPSVQNFIDNFKYIKKEQSIKYVNVEFATQLSYPVAQLLTLLIPESKNIEFSDSKKEDGPFQFLSTTINETQLNLIAYNEAVENKVDDFMRLLFSMRVGFEGGELNLLDPQGYVFWREYIKFPNRYRIPSSFVDNPPNGMTRKHVKLLYDNSVLTQQAIFTELWPTTISKEIYLYMERDQLDKHYFNVLAQKHINSSIMWHKLMQSLGYPELVAKDKYTLYDVDQLVLYEKPYVSIIDEMGKLERICAKSMLWVLSRDFNNLNIAYSYQSIISCLNVKDNYRNIVKRWLNYLSRNDYIIEAEPDNYIFDQMDESQLDILFEWSELEKAWHRNIMPISVIKYFKSHIEHMDQILKGNKCVNMLLFDQGKNDIANDLYSQTAISIFINEQIGQYVNNLSKNNSLSILELGAGTGATTERILDKVASLFTGQYIFTDISKYFLVSAEEMFRQYQFMKYHVLDIDNMEDNHIINKQKFDVIVAVGVINNSKNIKSLLNRLNEMLNENGKLLIGEAYGESAVMLISQAFMMTEPEDERKYRNMTFLSLQSWYEIFDETGFNVLTKTPHQTDELSSFNQALFILEKR